MHTPVDDKRLFDKHIESNAWSYEVDGIKRDLIPIHSYSSVGSLSNDRMEERRKEIHHHMLAGQVV
jgi:hypothetical protein